VTTVWSTSSDSPPTDGADDGDVVVRVRDDEVAFGRVQGGSVAWLDETMTTSGLPSGALDGLESGEALTAAPSQAALQTAVEGLETALTERGG